jgi:hypothetical protein
VNFNDFKDPSDLLPHCHPAVGLPRKARADALRKLVSALPGLTWADLG